MSNAELLQQPGYDEAQRKKFSDSILIMARQMRRLVESLLELARLDSAQMTNDFEELDFSALVEDCVLPFEPLFFEHGLELESDVEKDLRVNGNKQALRQCVDILLDNAQKYSEPGAVRLCLRRCGRSAELTVANPAPALKRGESEDIFKRFYRRDAARTGSGSYGLGLPIAKGIVARHGGKIICGWEAGEIFFTVTLPIV
jgi:signal transduction histidine kinase